MPCQKLQAGLLAAPGHLVFPDAAM